MKHLIIICAALVVFGVGATAQADMYWMSVDDLANMHAVSETDGDTVSGGGYQAAPAGRVAYKYYGTLTGADNGWEKLQIGYNWEPSGSAGANSMNGHGYPDLSDYDDFRMSFHNQDSDPIKVNMWLNTGYTDSGESAVYAELTDATRWTYLEQSNWVDLVLDFENADIWIDGTKTAGTSIPYLNHVTGIGFSVAFDTNTDYGYSVDVDTVPIPGAVLLGMLGLSVAGIKLRKYA